MEDSCEYLLSKYKSKVLCIEEFAGLWCGIPEDDIECILKKCKREGVKEIPQSENYPCLSVRVLFIIDAAIDKKINLYDVSGVKLPSYKSGGETGQGKNKRCVNVITCKSNEMFIRLQEAREWLEKARGGDIPENELPQFLFPSCKDSFKALLEENKKLKGLLVERKEENDRLKLEKEELENIIKKNKTLWKEGPLDLSRYGFAGEIVSLRVKGYTDEDIVKYCNDNYKFCNAQIGVLLDTECKILEWKSYQKEVVRIKGKLGIAQ